MNLPENQIICGDSLEVMKDWPDGCIDLVLTDPPYGINFDRATWGDDSAIYPEFMRTWLSAAQRLVGDGPCFVWQALPNAAIWHQWFPAEFRIFAACKGFVQYRPTPIQWSWDPVIYWGKIPGEPSVYCKDFHVQRLAPFGAGRERIDHPTPKPLEQVRYLVNLASKRDSIILDPFCGSGTTCVAAKMLGRRYIGIDISEEYCEIARKRLDAVDTGVPVKEQNKGQMALFPTTTLPQPQ